MLSLSATTGWGDPNKEKNPATAAALTTALVWSNVSDAIPVIAHTDSNCKSRLEIILKFLKSKPTQYNGKNDLPVVAKW